MKQCVFWLLCATMPLFSAPFNHKDRSSSYPYISGDSFRAYCDFAFDELDSSLIPSEVKKGSTIFVKTDYLEQFFNNVHPLITSEYILISHNSDLSAPGAFARYLDDDKIIVWFGQNTDKIHPKMHPIPIGIANKCWLHGNTSMLKNYQNLAKTTSKSALLYMNFCPKTYPAEREPIVQFFQSKPYCFISSAKSHCLYLDDLITAKFVLSPRGNGLDTHRTWESLLLGAIPIVRESFLDSLYENLPVVIIKNWSDITPEFLLSIYEDLNQKSYQLEKLYMDYWITLINSYKTLEK